MSDSGLSQFFSEQLVTGERNVTTVDELRHQLAVYNSAKSAAESAAVRMKAAKERLDELFVDLPDEMKNTQPQKATTVGGITFAREKKTITIDNHVIVMSTRIDTTFSRSKSMKKIDNAIRHSDNEAVKASLRELKSQLEADMNPHPTNIIKVEPANSTRTRRRS